VRSVNLLPWAPPARRSCHQQHQADSGFTQCTAAQSGRRAKRQEHRSAEVEISANRGGPAVAEGELVFIDNTVNVQTGTILLKARCQKRARRMWPGQFVAARIILKVRAECNRVARNRRAAGSGPSVRVCRARRQGSHAAGPDFTPDRNMVVVSKASHPAIDSRDVPVRADGRFCGEAGGSG